MDHHGQQPVEERQGGLRGEGGSVLVLALAELVDSRKSTRQFASTPR